MTNYATTIVIGGKDDSGSAFKSASGNLRNLAAETKTIGRFMKGQFLGREIKSLLADTFREARREGSALRETMTALEKTRAKELVADFERIEVSIQRIVLQLFSSLPGGLRKVASAAEGIADRLGGGLSGDAKQQGAKNTSSLKLGRTDPQLELDALILAADRTKAKIKDLRGENGVWSALNSGAVHQNQADILEAQLNGVNASIEFMTANIVKLKQVSRDSPFNAIRAFADRAVSNVAAGGQQTGGALSGTLASVGRNTLAAAKQESEQAVTTRLSSHRAEMQSRGASLREAMMTPQEKARVELEDARKLFDVGAIDGETLARKRDALDALRNPKEEITNALKQPGTTPGLQASESRFLTMGRGQMDPAAKAAVEGNRQRQRQIEQQKQAHDTLKRIEQKWSDAAKTEIVNTA